MKNTDFWKDGCGSKQKHVVDGSLRVLFIVGHTSLLFSKYIFIIFIRNYCSGQNHKCAKMFQLTSSLLSWFVLESIPITSTPISHVIVVYHLGSHFVITLTLYPSNIIDSMHIEEYDPTRIQLSWSKMIFLVNGIATLKSKCYNTIIGDICAETKCGCTSNSPIKVGHSNIVEPTLILVWELVWATLIFEPTLNF